MAVDLAHGRDAAEGAGDEGFIRGMHHIQWEGAETQRNAIVPAERNDIGAGDAVEAIFAAGGEHRAASHEEEVGGVTARHKAVGVEHQRFVRAGLDGFEQRTDQIEPAMRVEPHVEHLGGRATDGGGEQRKPARDDFWARFLVVGNNNDGRRASGVARVLVHRLLWPARDHEADMHAGLHPICGKGLVQCRDDLVPRHADVERDGAGALEQPVEMGIEKQKPALVQAQALPHAIAQHETGVEDRHLGLRTRHDSAVQIDKRVLVARIGCKILTARHDVP